MLSWMALIVALLLPPAQAAEAPATGVPSGLTVRQTGTELVLQKGVHELDPDQFARLVGDQHTLRAYNLAHKRVLLSSWMLWGMGAVGLGSGLTMLTMTPLADQPELLGASGAAVGLLGGVSLAVGFTAYSTGMARVNDPATWYTREQAEIWATGANGQSRSLELRPVFTGNGLALAARW